MSNTLEFDSNTLGSFLGLDISQDDSRIILGGATIDNQSYWAEVDTSSFTTSNSFTTSDLVAVDFKYLDNSTDYILTLSSLGMSPYTECY